MDLIKFDNTQDLYPEGVEDLFKDAFENYIKTGRYWEYYYNVASKDVFDRRWANFMHLVRIINNVVQKENFGFKRKQLDNHKIIIQKPHLITEDLPCTLCSHLAGKIITFQQFVCEMPLSQIKCCNYRGRCMGTYDLWDSEQGVIRDKHLSVENGKLKLKINL